jgi:hypothetical protein
MGHHGTHGAKDIFQTVMDHQDPSGRLAFP